VHFRGDGVAGEGEIWEISDEWKMDFPFPCIRNVEALQASNWLPAFWFYAGERVMMWKWLRMKFSAGLLEWRPTEVSRLLRVTNTNTRCLNTDSRATGTRFAFHNEYSDYA
jgi:hypothetical protein